MVDKIADNWRGIGEEPELYYKIKIEIQMFNQAQQFNSSTSTAFLPNVLGIYAVPLHQTLKF